MKIATWNINGVNRRLPLLLDWLAEAKPDVVALQETKTIDGAFPHAALEAAGYGSIACGQKTWNGVALLARDADPIEVRRALPEASTGMPATTAAGATAAPATRDKQARYLEAAVHGVLVTSIYLPNGNPYPGPKFDYKMAWFERLLRHAEALNASGHPVVLAGDFNVVPTELDVYKTSSYRDNALLQAEPRAAYAELLAQGWTDSIRALHPDERIYTFWDFLRNRWPRDAGLRIDHLLLSRSLAGRLHSAGVDREVRGREGASDHAPAWVVLDPVR
jgi:exodeoxyribonuclease-3